MKKILGYVLIGAVFYGIYTYRDDIKNTVNLSSALNTAQINIPKNIEIQNIVNKITNKEIIQKNICDEPIPYTIEILDERFGIDREYFLKALNDAEKIWEDETGKNLFVYDAQNINPMRINLIYDYRQETINELKKLGITVSQSRASYEEIKNRYNLLKSQYTKDKLDYETSLLAYNTRIKAFQGQVAYWNNTGGAPEKEYGILMQEKLFLEYEQSKLRNAQNSLNNLVNQINGLAGTLNKQAEVLNLNVKKYNTVGQNLGDSYEEGLYIEEGLNKRIDIYEFQNHEQLVRILAHEMGHALGIDHLENSESIMHAINSSKSLALTIEDKIAIGTICGLNIDKLNESD